MDDKNPRGLTKLLKSPGDKGTRNEVSSGPASKKSSDLVEENIDSQILSILGLEDVFDLTYEEYASLLKEAAVKGRMTNSQMTTESVELVTNELKRVRGKTGRFKVKQKKVSIDKVLNRKAPSPTSAIVKSEKLLPPTLEEEKKDGVEVKSLQGDVQTGITNILTSLVSIKGILQGQTKSDQETVKSERKKVEKTKKKDREDALEKKKEGEFKLPKAISTPIDNFFESIKRYFKNILLGSVVLGLYRWLKNPANEKTINDFGNFLTNNAPLILGGLLAIAALPIASTLLGLTGAVLGGIPTLIGALGFLSTPAGLAALAAAAGVAAAATLQNVVRPAVQNLVGGESVTKSGLKFKYEDIVSLRNKAYDFMVNAGAPAEEVNKQMKPYEDLMATMRYKKKINDELSDVRKNLKKREEEYKALGGDKVNTPINRSLKAEIQRLKEIENQKVKEKERSSTAIKTKFDAIGVGEAALEKAITSRGGKVERLGQSSQPTVQPKIPLTPGLPPLPPTNTLPGKQHYGAQRGGGRKHAGVDFDAGANDSFYSRIGGEVTNIGNDPGGYYRYVDIYNSELGVTERIAEGDNILVRRGQKVTPGTPVAKGTSTTGVFHYEIRKGKSTTFGFEGTLDPIAFLGNPTTQKGTSAQLAQTKPSTPSIPSPTGRSNIIPLPIPMGSQQASQSNSAPLQTPVPSFSSEDPNNMTTLVVRSIYNVVG